MTRSKRLCSEVANTTAGGFVNINLAPLLPRRLENSRLEVIEQLGWQLPITSWLPLASRFPVFGKIRKGIR